MGEFITRDRTGAPVLFDIKGDKPSPTEMSRISAILSDEPKADVVAPPKAEAPGILTVAGRGIARGWNEIQAGADTAMQSAFEGLGDPVRAKEWEQAAQEQRAERDTYATPQGSFLDSNTNKAHAVAGTIGQSGPSMALGLGGMGAGTYVGAALGSLAGPVGTAVGGAVGGFIGGALGYGPQMLNANAERQIEEHGYIKDWNKAYSATALQSGVETITDKLGLRVLGVLGDAAKVAGKAALTPASQKAIKAALDIGTKKAMTIVAKRLGEGAALSAVTGASEEVLQQGLERWQAELPLMDDKAKAEYLESAIMGGIVESIFGAGAGAYGGHKQAQNEKALREAEEDVDAEATELARQRDANKPLYDEKRKAPYIEDNAPEPAKKITDPGKLQPDFAETPEQKLTDSQEDQLPPGLRDEETEAEKPGAPADPLTPNPVTPEASVAAKMGAGTVGLGLKRLGYSITDLQHISPEHAQIIVRQGITAEDLKKRSTKFAKLLTTPPEADITSAVRPPPSKLGDLGYTPEEIEVMSPKDAKSIIRRGVPKVAPAPTVQKDATSATTPTPVIGAKETLAKPFTETEYRNAIGTLRDEGTLSVDKIAKTLGVSKPSAEAYLAEMLTRNDAHPAGNKNQYAKITVPHGMVGTKKESKPTTKRSRDYIVKPIAPADGRHPFSVQLNGKKIGKKGSDSFASREAAQEYIDKQVAAGKKKDATVVEDNAGLQYGLHEVQYEHRPGKEQRVLGEKVVSTYSTEAEAQAALKEHDPAYSPESNKLREKPSVEQRQAAIEADEQANELGPIASKMKALGEKVLGPGKLEVGVVPTIVNPKAPNAIVEGTSGAMTKTSPEGIRTVVGNLIRLANDIYNPNLSVEERARLMEGVFNHELVHALRSLDLLTPQEWDTLFQHAVNAKVPGKNYTWMQRAAVRAKGEKGGRLVEEAIAEMVRHYMNDPTAFRNPERGMLRKIADFIKKMMKMAQRHDAADLMDTIFEGGIADRQIGHGGLGPRNADDIRFSLLKDDNFYLDTARFLEKVTREEAPKNDWIKMLSSAGIKPEELNWLGIKQWLQDLPKGEMVHRNDIINYVKASGPKVTPVIFARKDHPDLADASISDPRWVDRSQTSSADRTYAEVAFTVPGIKGEPDFKDEGGHIMLPKTTVPPAGVRTAPSGRILNVLAFARFRDVTETIDGEDKKILFLEEIQSDLHQQGSMKGYFSKSFKVKLDEMHAQADAAYKEIRRMEGARIVIEDKIWALQRREREIRAETGGAVNEELLNNRRQVQALVKELTTVTGKPVADAKHAYNQMMQEIGANTARQSIPNAPFKTNWEDYVIRRMIRHAVEHGYHGIAWHGSPESVSATEGYGELEKQTDEKGRTQYLAYGETPVGPIVNRYLIKLPRITKGIADPFGATLDHNLSSRDPYGGHVPEAWEMGIEALEPPEPGELPEGFVLDAIPDRAVLDNLVSTLAEDHENNILDRLYLTDNDQADGRSLINRLTVARQIARNRRGEFAPVTILQDAGLNNDEISHVIAWHDSLDFYYAVDAAMDAKPHKGVAPYDNYRLMFNSAMTEGFERGDQPFFSSLSMMPQPGGDERVQKAIDKARKSGRPMPEISNLMAMLQPYDPEKTSYSMVRQRGDEIMANPNFQNWFAHSAVTHADGTPKIMFHGTRADVDFSRFHKMSHFGTPKAAEERLEAGRPGAWQLKKKPPPTEKERVFPVYLNIRRPLKIEDNGLTYANEYADAAFMAGGISEKEFDYLSGFEDERQAMTEFILMLEDKGYDGLEYINREEDSGSTSYAAFRPQQIKSIFNQGTFYEDDPDIMYSKLEARGADLLEDNDKFKKWFGNSRVTHPNGNPYLVFHGRGMDFDTFDEGFSGTSSTHPTSGLGFFFTADPKVANDFTAMELDEREWPPKVLFSEGSNVLPAFLSIKNPHVMDTDEFLALTRETGWSNKLPVIQLKRRLIAEGRDGIKVMADPERFGGGDEFGADVWVAFNPGQIKSALAEEFSLEDDSFKYSMVHPQYSASAPPGQRVPATPPIDRLTEVHNRMTYDNLSPVVHKLLNLIPGNRGKRRERADDTIISLQDRMLSIGRLIDRIKKNGGFISNENDVYLRETLYSGQTDAHLIANDRDFYEPMMKTINGLSVTLRDFNEAKTISPKVAELLNEYKTNHKHALAELYLYAQHAQERNAKMQARNERVAGERPMQYEAGSGMGDGEAQATLNWFASKPFAREFNDPANANSVRARMRAIVRSTNDIRIAAGLTPDFSTLFNDDGTPLDTYQDYVPIRGFAGEAAMRDDDMSDFAKTGKGFNIRGKEDYSALGRESMGRDLVAQAVMQNQETIVRAGKNKVAQSFRKLILDNPQFFGDSVAYIVAAPPTKYFYDRKSGTVRQRQDNQMDNDPTVLKGKVDGHQFYIQMKDPRIVRAMGTKSAVGHNTGLQSLLKGLTWVNRILAATRTSYNPEFMIANMLRDLQSAMINLSEFEQKGIRRKVMASVLPALNGVRKSLRSGNTNSEWAKVHEEFRRFGGHTAVFGIRELSDTLDTINKHLGEDVSGGAAKVMMPIRALGKFISDYNLAIENGTRLAAYKTLRDKYLELSGDPNNPDNQRRAKEMAAFAAKNLTVNFNMGGEAKGVLSAFYLFFNASMQGSMALLNPFIRSRKMKYIWASVLTAGAVQDMLMSMLSPEDDDGEKTYDKIPEHVLEHNMVFMDPFGISKRGYFKLPMPYLMNGIYNWGRAASRTARGKYTGGELLATGGMTMIDSLNPWGGSNSFLNFVAPSIIDPIVDLYQNEDFTGKPIAPPVSPYDNTGENRSQQFWNNTHPAFVSIADWMSVLTGREGDYIPGKMEYSPNQVEYVVDWATGGTGTFLARAGRLMYGAATGDLPEMEIEAGDIPFARKAYGQVTSKNDLQDYIEGRDQVLRVRKALRDARKEGDNELYMKIMRDYPKEYKVANRINALENARKKIGTKIKKIRDSTRISDERKEELVKSLKERQENLIGRGNEALTAID